MGKTEEAIEQWLPLLRKIREAFPPTTTPVEICIVTQMLLVETMHFDLNMSEEDSMNFRLYMVQALEQVVSKYHAAGGHDGCPRCRKERDQQN